MEKIPKSASSERERKRDRNLAKNAGSGPTKFGKSIIDLLYEKIKHEPGDGFVKEKKKKRTTRSSA
jgi:hypothetical protein